MTSRDWLDVIAPNAPMLGILIALVCIIGIEKFKGWRNRRAWARWSAENGPRIREAARRDAQLMCEQDIRQEFGADAEPIIAEMRKRTVRPTLIEPGQPPRKGKPINLYAERTR